MFNLFKKEKYSISSMDELLEIVKNLKSKYDKKKENGTFCINDQKQLEKELAASIDTFDDYLTKTIIDLQRIQEEIKEFRP